MSIQDLKSHQAYQYGWLTNLRTFEELYKLRLLNTKIFGFMQLSKDPNSEAISIGRNLVNLVSYELKDKLIVLVNIKI